MSGISRAPVGRVLAVGDINIDIVFTGLPHLPRTEQDTLAQDLVITVGGQTGTIARALAQLGLSVTFVGRVGSDRYGRLCADELARAGVDLTGLVTDPVLRTGATVVLSCGTERGFATYLGSISAVRRSDVTEQLLACADHLHVGSYFLLTGLHPDMLDLFRTAKQKGLTTSCDPGWDPFMNWDRDILKVLHYVDVFLPNEVEAQRITGADAPEKALSRLAKYGHTIVIKRGAYGCIVRQGTRTVYCPAFEVQVMDVTSAGDVFNAGFLYAWLGGQDLEDCARFANACGALSVARAGNLGMPRLEEVEAFLASRGAEPKDLHLEQDAQGD